MEEEPGGLGKALEEVLWEEVVGQVTQERHDGEGALTEDEVRFARTRARELVAGVRAGEDPPLAGLRDMQLLAQAMGLPVPRILFAEMIARCSATTERKRAFSRGLKDMSPLTETGCISTDFLDRTTGAAGKAFLVLEPCEADHDLGAQLDPFYARIPPEKQEDIRQFLSMLVYMGRQTFHHMLETKRALVGEITKKLPEGFDPSALGVDPANTTLFLPPPCSQRVGIFVRYLDEMGTEGGCAPPADGARGL